MWKNAAKSTVKHVILFSVFVNILIAHVCGGLMRLLFPTVVSTPNCRIWLWTLSLTVVLMLPFAVHVLQAWMGRETRTQHNSKLCFIVIACKNILNAAKAMPTYWRHTYLSWHKFSLLPTYRFRHGLMEGTISPTWYVVLPLSLTTEQTDGKNGHTIMNTFSCENLLYMHQGASAWLATCAHAQQGWLSVVQLNKLYFLSKFHQLLQIHLCMQTAW